MIFHLWYSKSTSFIALGIASMVGATITISTPVMAKEEPYIEQLISQSSQVILTAGTTIPVRYDAAETIVITPKETVPVTLLVAKNIRSNQGSILIPKNSQIKGELKPVSGGTQFLSKELILSNSNQSLPIDAVSEIIAETKTVNETTKPNVFKGAAVGAGAGALLGGIFGGRLNLGTILGGAAGAGVAELDRGRKQTELVVIDPDTDLHFTLQADLVSR